MRSRTLTASRAYHIPDGISSGRLRAGCLLFALAALACSERGDYVVRAYVPGGPARAVRVELSVLESCRDVHTSGDAPEDPLRQVEAIGDTAEPIGVLAAGTYGLYGRAWEPGCRLYAAGCDGFEVRGDEKGTVEVVLSELAVTHVCDLDEACTDNHCMAVDGGVVPGDGGVDAEVDAEVDAGVADRCQEDPRIGGVALEGALSVTVDGPTAWVGTYEQLVAVDVVDPFEPAVLGALPTAYEVNDVAVSGGIAVVSAATAGSVVFDVSDPVTPVELGSVPNAPNGDARGVALYDSAEGTRTAYVADGDPGLMAVNVDDPMAPAEIRTIETNGVSLDVVYQHPYAYVADGLNGLRILEPDTSEIVGRQDLPDSTSYGVAVVLPHAYVASHDGGLFIVDVFDPAAPFLTGQATELPHAFAVVYWQGYAIVASEEDGLGVVDVSDPWAPALVSNFDLEGPEVGIALLGDRVLVTTVEGGLHVLDLPCLTTR